MFSWFKKSSGEAPARKEPPPLPANLPPKDSPAQSAPTSGNPSKGYKFSLATTGPAGKRQENIDLLQILGGVFQRREREHSIVDSALRDTATGLEFRPGIVSSHPNDDLSMRMCTTIEIRHPAKFPRPFFEYQHSADATGERAVTKGFEQWADLDLPVLLDALETQPKTCSTLEMNLPSGKIRRFVLGPVYYLAPRTHGPLPSDAGDEVHSPFCPCCMFTRSFEALKSLATSDGYHAIRFYAHRDEEGQPEADCRVNGEDHAPGKDALIAYVRTWPSTGFEFRKQYVVIQDKPPAADSGS